MKRWFASISSAHVSVVGLLAASWLVSCSDSSSAPRLRPTPNTELRRADANPGQGGDALAAALILATKDPVVSPSRGSWQSADASLENRMRFHAQAHLEQTSFGSGPGAGLRIEGSARIRRLAQAPDAPADRNGNGTNLDETAMAELNVLGALAGAAPLDQVWSQLMPLPNGSERLLNPRPRRGDYLAARTQPPPRLPLSMTQLGETMLARVVAASSLLKESRGSRPGTDPERGLLGMRYLLQAVAIEETLFDALFMRADTRALARFSDASNYDPTNGKRWLPSEFAVSDDERLPNAAGAYAPVDGAESLQALAAVLRAAAEMSWLASDANPYPALRDSLNGNPFGSLPSRRRRGVVRPFAFAEIGPTEFFYEENVKPILDARCVTCHNQRNSSGGLDLSTFASLLRGGRNAATNPTIVRGNAEASLLWQVLVLDRPPTFPRMPPGSPLPQGDIDTIRDWINQGARRSPPTPPALGTDLVQVLVKNIARSLLHPSGGLHDRHEGDGAGASGHASSVESGQALMALAAAQAAIPNEETRQTLRRASQFAVDRLSDSTGAVLSGYDLERNLGESTGDLDAHAALAAGLLAAGRILDEPVFANRGRQITSLLLNVFWDGQAELFVNAPGRESRRLPGRTIAMVLEVLRESAAVGVAGAGDVHDRFLRKLLPQLVLSEWDGLGEILGDDVADSDGNGIPEPGPLAPVFAGEIRAGPDPQTQDGPVTWSRHIAPLLRNTCAGCHVDGANRGNYRCDTPALLATPGDSRGQYPLLVPGDPEGSFFYRKLVDRRPAVGDQMPLQQPPLDAHGKELVRRWILEGATRR